MLNQGQCNWKITISKKRPYSVFCVRVLKQYLLWATSSHFIQYSRARFLEKERSFLIIIDSIFAFSSY